MIADAAALAGGAETDVMETARLLVEAHGSRAIGIADHWALAMHAIDDGVRAAVWCRVVAAIATLVYRDGWPADIPAARLPATYRAQARLQAALHGE